MKLLIVESYNKIKSIKKFLGADYEVIASGGHIRELKSIGYGFNKDTMMPIWEPHQKKQSSEEKTIAQVKRCAKEATQVLLATDPDREGESISWHLFDILPESDQAKCKRITFNEITKKAIDLAVLNPRDIDMNLVYSQWARRILDRLVGYGLSSLVKSKLSARSAGRVQSVALLFIVERYFEIKNFTPRFWWTIDTKIQTKDKKLACDAFLRLPAKSYEAFEKSSSEFKFALENEAQECIKNLTDKFEVYEIDEPKITDSKSFVPFQTDTLLTSAYNKLGWGTAKTNKMAQELYNGINVSGETVSLISYPRTDTNRLNEDFINTVWNYVDNEYGAEYICKNVKAATHGALVQGAHEGIRPIDVLITPKTLEGKIDEKNARDLLKLYTLIWTQTVASYMNPPRMKTHIIRFKNNENKFYTSYKKLFFKGYFAIPHIEATGFDNDIDLTDIRVGDILTAGKDPVLSEHKTVPPALYNEGSLVKELKNSGVGRPSTYSTMVNIVKDRGYVENGTQLAPTELGILLIQNLIKECSDFVSKEFTVKMESDLDEIAEGRDDWNKWIRAFKEKFDAEMLEARKNMPKAEPKLVGRKCPNCGNELVYQTNRRDKSQFIGCIDFKGGCKYTETLPSDKPKPVPLDELCPECNNKLIQRYNKKGDPFIACTGFPKCRYIKSLKTKAKAETSETDSTPAAATPKTN